MVVSTSRVSAVLLTLAGFVALGCSGSSTPEPVTPTGGASPQLGCVYPPPPSQPPPGVYPAPGGGYPQQPPPGAYPQQPVQPPPGAYPQQPGQPPPAGYGQPLPLPPPGAPGAVPPGPFPPGPPPAAPPGSFAQPVDPAAAAAVQTALIALAKDSAMPGAKPVGAPLVGQFLQGQVLQTQVQLVPGKCYSVVAAGLPPVAEVNVQFVAIAPIPGVGAVVLAQDSDAGPQAILGKRPNCFKWAAPFPGPANLVLAVPQGQGFAGAQLFEK